METVNLSPENKQKTTMQTIQSLANLSFDALFIAFAEAFGTYEIQINRAELEVMLSRRGFDQKLSFGAFDGDKLVSFTFNGIGQYNGIPTAYDTGTGTLPGYQGKGLASAVFNYSIPFLKQVGVEQYLLEVLQHNEKAVSVYRKQGFQVSREFSYFVSPQQDVKTFSGEIPEKYYLKPVTLDLHAEMQAMWDFMPSWQNSFDSVRRRIDDFIINGIFSGEKLVAYCIFEPNSGDITQLAVSPKHRNKNLASALLAEAVKVNRHPNIKLINAEVNCQALRSFLEKHGIQLQGKQFEMIKPLL